MREYRSCWFFSSSASGKRRNLWCLWWCLNIKSKWKLNFCFSSTELFGSQSARVDTRVRLYFLQHATICLNCTDWKLGTSEIGIVHRLRKTWVAPKFHCRKWWIQEMWKKIYSKLIKINLKVKKIWLLSKVSELSEIVKDEKKVLLIKVFHIFLSKFHELRMRPKSKRKVS